MLQALTIQTITPPPPVYTEAGYQYQPSNHMHHNLATKEVPTVDEATFYMSMKPSRGEVDYTNKRLRQQRHYRCGLLVFVIVIMIVGLLVGGLVFHFNGRTGKM